MNFLKSLTNSAKNVKGTAKLKPSFSGIKEPKTIPKKVVVCHIIQQVAPHQLSENIYFHHCFF